MAKKEEPKEGKEPEEEKRKWVYKPGIGTIGVLIVSMIGLFFSIMMGMPLILLIVCVIGIVFAVISFVFKPKWRLILIIPFFLIIVILAWTGQFNVVLTQPAVAKGIEQVRDTYDNAIEQATQTYERGKCYAKYVPDQVEACLQELEEKEKGGGEYFTQKEYITLEIRGGNPYRDYKQNTPKKSGGRGFDWEVTLINKNEKIFDIDITYINASTNYEDSDDIYTVCDSGCDNTLPIEIPYNLLPNKELYLRLNFADEFADELFKGCDSKKFELGVKTQQTGGTDSWFGIAPNDMERDWQEFIQGYDPNYEPDPGPLDIFAFTYPFGIDQDQYKERDIQIIITLRNPKADGVILVEEFYFIQTFKFPHKYFTINSCTLLEGMTMSNESTGRCGDNPNYSNCFKFEFNPKLEIPKDETEEIICYATVEDEPLTDKYDDFMRVEATYDFFQEWDEKLTCTGVEITESS